MSARLFAGLDLGTGGCRCLVLDERGGIVAAGERPWSYRVDPTGFPVLDPEPALQAARGALADAARGCDVGAVAALGVASQRTGAVLLGDGDIELLISPNADGRGAAAGIEQERAHGEAIYRIAGRLPALIYLPARLAWAREQLDEPVTGALSLSDWLVWRMTGARATEPTQAADTLCFDIARGVWSEELMDTLGVARDVLPPVLPAGEAAGALGQGWSFSAGMPVVPAGGDTGCAALAAGVTAPGSAMVVAGTTMLAAAVIDGPAIDPDGRLWTTPAAAGERFLHEAHCGDAGAFVAWSAALLDVEPARLAEEATAGVPGAGGATIVGTYAAAATDFPLLRRGTIAFPAPVLALGRPRADIARAVFEGAAFAAWEGLRWLAERAGEPERIRVTGGGSRSAVFTRALAGALDRPVEVTTEVSASARGAAIVGAGGAFGGIDAAADALAGRCEQVSPDPSDGYPAHLAAWLDAAAEARAHAVTMKGILA